MHPKSTGCMAASVEPDQTALLGAVSSGSTLFAEVCMSIQIQLTPAISNSLISNNRLSRSDNLVPA